MIQAVCEAFGLRGARERADAGIAGSPERSVWRTVVADADGASWVVERLHPGQAARREAVGALLAGLAARGLGVVAPYRAAPDGAFCLAHAGAAWQVSPFVAGEELPRPGYIWDAGRGEAVGGVLGALAAAATGLGAGLAGGPALPGYVDGLMAVLAAREPGVHARCAAACRCIAPLCEAWGELPHMLAHGDLHPLNLIWQGGLPVALIDWEFAGPRPELYDAANCIGCVGVEDPAALAKGFVPAFVAALRDLGVLRPDNAQWLMPLVVGLRFAWLSEWLRRRDREMVALELDYLDLLAERAPALVRAWAGHVEGPGRTPAR
ncbi:MAG: phosphotransferase [Desulfovibrionaceae bacterium]